MDSVGGQEGEEGIQRVVDVNWAFGEWICGVSNDNEFNLWIKQKLSPKAQISLSQQLTQLPGLWTPPHFINNTRYRRHYIFQAPQRELVNFIKECVLSIKTVYPSQTLHSKTFCTNYINHHLNLATATHSFLRGN